MKKWRTSTVLTLCIVLLGVYAYPQCQEFIHRVQLNLKTFVLLKADYEQLYEIAPIYRTIKEIKNTLPDNAKIAISYPSDRLNIKNIFIRYTLYPCIITPNWSYFIDLNHSLPDPPPADLQVTQLSNGVRIFAKKGHAFHRNNKDYHGKLLSKNLLLFIGLSCWLVFIGSLILKGPALSPIQGNGSWFFSSAYLLGLLIFCIPLWSLLMLGAPFNPLTVFALMIFISIITFLLHKIRISGLYSIPSKELPSIDGPKRMGEYFSDVCCLALIFLFLGIIISIPISVWDEMVIWIIKARTLCASQGLDFSYTLPAHNHYPILWPLDNAFYFLIIGDYDEIAKWISALTFFAFLAQIRGCLFFLGIRRRLLWPLVILYLILFHHWTFYTALPENLFMALLTAMSAWLILWFKDPLHSRKYLILGLIMALSLGLVKLEGTILACLGGLSLILTQKKIQFYKKDFLWVGGWVLMLLLIPWGWSHWVEAQGNKITWYPLHLSSQNITILINMVGDFLRRTKIFFLIGPILLSLWALNNRRPWSQEEKFLLIWSIFLMLFSIVSGLFWPYQDLQKYYPEVFSRLLIRATPTIMLLWATRYVT